MDVYEILPVLAPGVFMQVLIQAYFIKHCWENESLSRRAKVLYTIAIAALNILGAAMYLFLTRKRESRYPDDFHDLKMDGQLQKGIFVLLVVAYEVTAFRILSATAVLGQNPALRWILASCFVLMIISGLGLGRHQKILHRALPAVQIALAMAADYLDTTQSTQFIVLAVVASVINDSPLRPARLYSLCALILYLVLHVVKLAASAYPETAEDVLRLYGNLLMSGLVFASFYMLKKQFLSNKRLKEQALMLEEMSALAERNRITGEIHDTVGHTLTSAAIAIEAGEKLLEQDTEAAREKFALAKEQVRRGLNDIRHSVKTIRAGGEKQFLPELNRLIDDIRRNMGLPINGIVEMQSELLPIQQSVLLRAVQECATNSVKHGMSSQADLLVQEYRGVIRMTFSDNGKGTGEIVFGFGLDNMAQRVKSIGGTLKAESAKGEGFTVSITMPTGITAGGERV